MNGVSQTTFWSTTTIMASAIGGVLILASTHAGEPKHPEAADESQVSELKVKVERVATNVENNARILDEVKIEIKELRTEQRQSSQEILRAIEAR
jgi:septal ring factor EnvC (AmiA/AmiB activator)